MGFNCNTWSKSYTEAHGLKRLAAADAVRQGYKPLTPAARKRRAKANKPKSKE